MSGGDRIGSAEAAARLGVKVQTLYAYVSRGLLTSAREPGVRGTTFDVAEVERLARSGTRRGGRPVAVLPFKAVSSEVSSIEGGVLRYRGVDAVDLARENDAGRAAAGPAGVAAVRAAAAGRTLIAAGVRVAAGWVLAGDRDLDWAPRAAPLAAARSAAPLVAGLTGAARLRVLVTVAGAADPLRLDLSSAAALRSAITAITVVVESAGELRRVREGGSPGAGGSGSTGDRRQLRTHPPAAAAVGAGLPEVADAALVLLMDHGLATSTVAARVAASARADPYACLCAALSAFEGPLHGRAGVAAQDLLTAVVDGEPAGAAVEAAVRRWGGAPGFGHPLYPAGDPRAAELLTRLRAVPAAAGTMAAVDAVTAVVDALPTVDLALAALCLAAGLPPSAGEELFALARSVGWCAHALEEYGEAPLRWRGQGT